jgi:hypothetical protein
MDTPEKGNNILPGVPSDDQKRSEEV